MPIYYKRLVFLSLIFPSLTAQAASICKLSAETGLRLESFDYRERNEGGVLLDKESGLLPGLQLGFQALCDDWGFAVSALKQRARLDYDGQTNAGRKLFSRTLENVGEISLQVERHFSPERVNSFSLYGGAGYRQWQRDIASIGNVSGLDETYRWRFYYVGNKLRLFQGEHHQFMVDMRWQRIIRPSLSVDFLGVFDRSQDLVLGAHNAWRLATPWVYKMNASNGLRIEPYLQAWRIARSASKPLLRSGVEVGNFFEPASATRLYGITAAWVHEY